MSRLSYLEIFLVISTVSYSNAFYGLQNSRIVTSRESCYLSPNPKFIISYAKFMAPPKKNIVDSNTTVSITLFRNEIIQPWSIKDSFNSTTMRFLFQIQEDVSGFWKKIEDVLDSFRIRVSTKVERDLRATTLTGEYIAVRAKKDTNRVLSGVDALTRPILALPATVQKISDIANRDDDGAAVRNVWSLVRQGVNPLEGPQLLGSFRATNTRERLKTLPASKSDTPSPLSAVRAVRTLPSTLQYDYNRRIRRRETNAKSIKTSRMLPDGSSSSNSSSSRGRSVKGGAVGVSDGTEAGGGLGVRELSDGLNGDEDMGMEYGMGSGLVWNPFAPPPEDYWDEENDDEGVGGGGVGQRQRDTVRETAVEFSWAMEQAETALMATFSEERDIRLSLKQLQRNKDLLGSETMIMDTDSEGMELLSLESELTMTLETTRDKLALLRSQVQGLRRARDAIESFMGRGRQASLTVGEGALCYERICEGIRIMSVASAPGSTGWGAGADNRQRIRVDKPVLLSASLRVSRVEGIPPNSEEELWLELLDQQQRTPIAAYGQYGQGSGSRRGGRPSNNWLSNPLSILKLGEQKEEVWTPGLMASLTTDLGDATAVGIDIDEDVDDDFISTSSGSLSSGDNGIYENGNNGVGDGVLEGSVVRGQRRGRGIDVDIDDVFASTSDDFDDVMSFDDKEDEEDVQTEKRDMSTVVDVTAESVSTAVPAEKAATLLIVSALDVLLFLTETLIGALLPIMLGGGSRIFKRAFDTLVPQGKLPKVRYLSWRKWKADEKMKTRAVSEEDKDENGIDDESESDKDWVLLRQLDR